jgi:hypothetical protein
MPNHLRLISAFACFLSRIGHALDLWAYTHATQTPRRHW